MRHQRATNMLFEGSKEHALVIVPLSAADTMNLGGMLGAGVATHIFSPKES